MEVAGQGACASMCKLVQSNMSLQNDRDESVRMFGACHRKTRVIHER